MVSVKSEESGVATALVSRTGRDLQRYDKLGRRLVVGCLPYRYKPGKQSSFKNGEEVEVLVISSQKGSRMLFPKGGWEIDESMKEAASRETLEEAGVKGIVEPRLGSWSFKSQTRNTYCEGYMFPLLVQEELDVWPEKNLRQRQWMSTTDARRACHHSWMREALDELVKRLSAKQQQQDEKDKLDSSLFTNAAR